MKSALGLSMILISFWAATGSTQVRFGPNVLVEDTADALCTPALVRDSAGSYYAVWSDWREGSVIDATVFFSRSTDGGQTWLWPSPQVSDLTPVMEMDLVRDSLGYLYCLWTNGQVTHLSRSTDNGDNWSNPSIPVLDHTANSMEGPRLCLGAGSQVYATWSDDSQGWGVWFSKSTDYGLTWSPNTLASSGWGVYSAIAKQLNTLYCVYTGSYSDIRFTKSTNEGATWSPERIISDTIWCDAGLGPSLAIGPQGNLYVLWMDGRNGGIDVYMTRSTDGGSTWLSPARRVNDTTYSKPVPSDPAGHLVCDAGGKLHAAWMDARDGGNYAIYYSQSADGGNTWLSPNVKVTDDPAHSGAFYPYLAVDPQGEHPAALWMDLRRGYRIFFARGGPVGVEEDRNQEARRTKGQGLKLRVQSPAGRTLTLEYYLPNTEEAHFALFDVAGREVDDFSPGRQGPGWHQATKNMNLPSGIYFLELKASGKSATAKCVVVR